MPLSLKLTADQVTALARLMPPGVLSARSMWDYEAGALLVPDGALTAAVNAIVANPNWEQSASAAALISYAASAQAAILSAGVTVNVAPASAAPVNVLCDGANATRADLAMLALYGQLNPAGAQTWLDNHGVATVLSGAQCVALATAVGNWIAGTYAAMAALVAGIKATPPTITAPAQIDAALAAVKA